MGLVDQLKSAFAAKKRDPNDANTDLDELTAAGVTVQRGDPRLRSGITMDNMTSSERDRVLRYRKQGTNGG